MVEKTSPKKMNLSPFKLFCVYLDLLSLSINVSDFSRSIIRDFKERTWENSSSYVHVLHKTSHWKVSRSSHAGGRQRKFNVLKCQTRDASAEGCCFAHKTNCFYDVVVVVALA